MSQYPVGTRVRMTESGFDRWGNQSSGGLGIVTHSRKGGYWPYEVKWDTGKSFQYNYDDVVRINAGCPCGICQGTV